MALGCADIVLQVSTQLNDQEPGFTYIRWTASELLTYLNESLLEVCNYRSDAFTLTQDIPINATAGGTLQNLPTGFRQLKSIDANGTASGCPGAPIVQADLNLMRTFYKAPCLLTGAGALGFRVLTYAYDAKNPKVFYVSPPVPAGNTSTVTATLVQEPQQFIYPGDFNINTALTMDPKWYNASKFWMLARAYEVDTESNTSQAESQTYYKKFYNLLGVQYKQDSSYSKGTYLGQGGDNQITKERVA
jgi:hypothetical protein